MLPRRSLFGKSCSHSQKTFLPADMSAEVVTKAEVLSLRAESRGGTQAGVGNSRSNPIEGSSSTMSIRLRVLHLTILV